MNNSAYKKSIGCIGTGMLFFLLFFTLFSFVILITQEVLNQTAKSEQSYAIIYYTIYGIGYMACFMGTGLIIKGKLKKHHLTANPVASDYKLSPYLPIFTLAGITVIMGSAYFNAMLMEVFNYSAFSSEVIWADTEETAPYLVAINVIVIGFIPGLVEEFLFRGVICENLLPYGKSNAIFISAVLFGLMHQNGEQILFAFCAGILLGLVYTKTRNIWNCTIIHLSNNIFSILESYIVSKYGGIVGSVWGIVIEAVVFCIGAVCLCYCLIKFFSGKKENAEENGSFYEKELPENDNFATMPIDRNTAVKGFFRPTIIVFLCFVVIEVVYLILMSVGVISL